MSYGSVKVIPPPRRPPLKARVRRKKPEGAPRVIQHKILGAGVLRAIRASASGGYVVECDFGGTVRILQLRQEFWETPIVSVLKLIGHLPPPPAPKPEPVPVEETEDPEKDGEQADEEHDGEDDEHDVCDSEDGEGDDGDDEDRVRDEAETIVEAEQ